MTLVHHVESFGGIAVTGLRVVVDLRENQCLLEIVCNQVLQLGKILMLMFGLRFKICD
jgi:hypothetical protein